MNKQQIIRELDGEIERLRRARIVLASQSPEVLSAVGRSRSRQGRRFMSAAVRARISAGQKKRWARRKGKTAPSADARDAQFRRSAKGAAAEEIGSGKG